ncbi:MAG: hypothetical protein HYV62_13825 [Candidatus Rokubacteria bacterium]|nr:hypothetical protein [Candidatus Rokubacteria bacterium]
MGRLHLDFACGSYDRTRALQDGSIEPEGIDLTYIPIDPPEEVFWRMRHPWIAQSLFKALSEAKARCAGSLYDARALRAMLPWAIAEYEEARRLMGNDFWPYGLEANRTVLETFVRYASEQGVAARPVAVDELFAPETLDTFRT